jgi:hypothetical protein
MNRCDALSDNMTMYHNLYYYLEGTLDGREVLHISRSSNEEGDTLTNIGSQCLPIPAGVFCKEIIERSIQNMKPSGPKKSKQQPAIDLGAETAEQLSNDKPELEDVMMIEVTWMQPYLAYMINKQLPEDVVEARRIVSRSKAFVVLKGELYKNSISGVLQHCITPQEGQAILQDINAGVCSHHASSRAIASKAFIARFYWLTAVEDAKDIVHCYEACQ